MNAVFFATSRVSELASIVTAIKFSKSSAAAPPPPPLYAYGYSLAST